MLLPPAAVSRSQTDWATSAGVAMTPIAAAVAATTSPSSSTGRTGWPPIRPPPPPRPLPRAPRLPADPPAHPVRGGVEQPDEAEPPAAEAGVVGQGGAQVAD